MLYNCIFLICAVSARFHYQYRAASLRDFEFAVRTYLAYETRKCAHKREELPQGNFAQNYIYIKVLNLEVATTGNLTPLNRFAADYRHEFQVPSYVGNCRIESTGTAAVWI